MNRNGSPAEAAPTPNAETVAPQPDGVAWEELENGRFRPRRVRGSCLGMELG